MRSASQLRTTPFALAVLISFKSWDQMRHWYDLSMEAGAVRISRTALPQRPRAGQATCQQGRLPCQHVADAAGVVGPAAPAGRHSR
jgi:hypothetical protein